MNSVTLIQCTDSKRDHAAPAKDLYDESAYFCRMRAWAEARGDPWYILSAKHGLVDPETRLEPYDQRGISETQAETIATQLHEDGVGTVHVTAGTDYTAPLVPALEARGIDVVNHFAGEGIGKRKSLLKRATREIVNEKLC
jgi:hypothetical protein